MPVRVNDPKSLEDWIVRTEQRIRDLEARRLDPGSGTSIDPATKEISAKISEDPGNSASIGEDGGIKATDTVTTASPHDPFIIQMYKTASQTIGTGADVLAVFEASAASGTWTFTTTTITIPEDGWYHVNVEWQWGTNATGNRVVHITLNSTSVPAGSIAASSKDPEDGEPTHTLSHYHTFLTGDVLRVYVFQNSGGNLGGGGPYFGDVRGRFTVAKYGDSYPPDLTQTTE